MRMGVVGCFSTPVARVRKAQCDFLCESPVLSPMFRNPTALENSSRGVRQMTSRLLFVMTARTSGSVRSFLNNSLEEAFLTRVCICQRVPVRL